MFDVKSLQFKASNVMDSQLKRTDGRADVPSKAPF